MPAVWDFVLVTFATFYVLLAWQRGSIFERPRAYLQAREGGFLADWLTCTLCLSWVAACVFYGLLLLSEDYPVAKFPVVVFAVAGVVPFLFGSNDKLRY
jgi:hypothetical protein